MSFFSVSRGAPLVRLRFACKLIFHASIMVGKLGKAVLENVKKNFFQVPPSRTETEGFEEVFTHKSLCIRPCGAEPDRVLFVYIRKSRSARVDRSLLWNRILYVLTSLPQHYRGSPSMTQWP